MGATAAQNTESKANRPQNGNNEKNEKGSLGELTNGNRRETRMAMMVYDDLNLRLKSGEFNYREYGEKAGMYKNYESRLTESERGLVDLDACESANSSVYRRHYEEDAVEYYQAKDYEVIGETVTYSVDQLKALGGAIFQDLKGKHEVLSIRREAVPKEQIAERKAAFGLLGEEMHRRLLKNKIATRAVGLLSQRNEVEILTKKDGFLAAAYSLLYAEVPIQTGGSETLLTEMAQVAYDTESMKKSEISLNSEKHFKYFPLKKNRSVENKTNIYFTEVWESLNGISKAWKTEFLEYSGNMLGMYNDQAAACILYYAVLRRHGFFRAERIAMSAIKYPERAGHLSTAIKSLGMQWRLYGALLIEAGSLQGRGVGEIDLVSIMTERASEDVRETVLKVNQSQLAEQIKAIFDDEMMMDRYVYEAPSHFWSRRWEWGANGAHSRLLEKKEPQWKVEPEGLKRLHKRVYFEEIVDSPMDSWSGNTYVSCIKKVENEKERDLQSIDSNTYVAFEHLAQGVEGCWKGRKIILNPGEGGTMRMSDRIRAMKKRTHNGYNVMIDYAKYNTQHSLESQKTVISVLCEKVGYPEAMAKQLIESFDKMELYVDGEYVGVAKGTLMSGHRMTTFINSVLNLAYLKVFCPKINETLSMHVGDDVYVSTPDLLTATQLMKQLRESPIRAKQEKQSLGEWSAEFLRMCTRGSMTRGYVCRSISTCIMGNWVNDVRMGAEDALKNMVSASWTLGNRAQWPEVGRLLVASVGRVTGIDGELLKEMLTGTAALNDGPQRFYNLQRRFVRVDAFKIRQDRKKTKFKAEATRTYLTNHVTPLESDLLEMLGLSVTDAMIEASYGKSSEDISSALEKSSFELMATLETKGCYSHNKLDDIKGRKPLRGALEGYVILNLFKNQVQGESLKYALMSVGVDLTGRESEEELHVLAWGARFRGVVINGWCPYADAASLSRISDRDIVEINNELYFV